MSEKGRQLRRAANGGVIAYGVNLDRELASLRRLARAQQKRLSDLRSNRVVGVAQIERERGPAWDDVGHPRYDLELADRRDQTLLCRRRGLGREHELGGGGQRVAPAIHRHRSRVARLAREHDLHPALSRDRGHDANRQASGFEHGTLFDVNLEVAQQIPAAPSVVLDS